MGYPIRKFEKKDTEQVMRIWLDGNIETHGFVPEAYWMSPFHWCRSSFCRPIFMCMSRAGQYKDLSE